MSNPHSLRASFFFLVHNRNHVRLFAPVAQGLREAGQGVQFVHLQEIQKRSGALGLLQDMGLTAIPVSQLFEILSAGAYTTTYSAVAFNGFAPLQAYVI